MEYKVALETFQGPMELLIHLIDKSKIDIYDIPINLITSQFLEHIEGVENLDLEIASDFIIMASTLIEIKSKIMLPQKDEEDEDPRVDLVKRLEEYRKYKEVSKHLSELENESLKTFFKPRDEINVKDSKFTIESFFSINILKEYIENILLNNNIKKNIIINDKHEDKKIKKQKYDIKDCILYLEEIIKKNKAVFFNDFLKNSKDIEEIVTYFLAILELSKLNKIKLYQKGTFKDIKISLKEYCNEKRET